MSRKRYDTGLDSILSDRIAVMAFLLFSSLFQLSLSGQAWNFVKERDGIKLYTRTEEGKSLKSFKGEADIDASPEKVYTMIENVNNTDWWDRNLSQIRILRYEKNKKAQYYLVYKLPWPVADRDLCADVTVTADSLTGRHVITAVPLTGFIPEKNGIVRVKVFRQSWTIVPLGKERTHVVLEGFIDPGGDIPDWIINMLITESPYRSVKGVIDRMAVSH